LDYLILPWRLAFSGGFDTIRFDGAIGPFLILAVISAVASVVVLVRCRLAGSMVKEIGLMFAVSAAFFMFGTQQTRFWLPSQMLACAFAAPVVERLVSWAKNRLFIKKVLFLILVGSLVWNMWFLGKQFLAVGYYKPVLGMEEERAFLIRKVPGYLALEFINRNLPKNSRTLCVWTGVYGYYIDRQYYSDTFIEDFTLKRLIDTSATGKEFSQRLTQAGYTHIFLRLSLLAKNTTLKQKEIFRDFLESGAIQLFCYQDFLILRIRGS
jgi:hypothetical protein